MRITRVLLAVQQRGAKPNLTGFDLKAFHAATRKPQYDPWARHEAWRSEGPFTRWNRFRRALPGLGSASVAFAIYCVYEHFFLNKHHHHHSAEKGAHGPDGEHGEHGGAATKGQESH